MSGGSKAIVWDANCGNSFGHELTFGRALELGMGYQTEFFEMIKSAVGGTEIYRHWYPEHGEYWPQLRQTIRDGSSNGNWKAFVWHQGTQGMYDTKSNPNMRSMK